jgi:hypothetical protein
MQDGCGGKSTPPKQIDVQVQVGAHHKKKEQPDVFSDSSVVCCASLLFLPATPTRSIILSFGGFGERDSRVVGFARLSLRTPVLAYIASYETWKTMRNTSSFDSRFGLLVLTTVLYQVLSVLSTKTDDIMFLVCTLDNTVEIMTSFKVG